MPKASLVFTKKKNLFLVKIENMEILSVSQIQELELFVKSRNGIFDFTRYEFIINKNLEFHQFESLVKYAEIDAKCRENIIYKKNQPRISFGQYKGMQFSDLSDTYMSWLKSNYRGSQREYIDAEVLSRKL